MVVSSVTVTIVIENLNVMKRVMVVPVGLKGCAWLCWSSSRGGELFSLQVVTAAQGFGNGVILSHSFGIGI